MKSKIYSSENIRISSKRQIWIPAFALLAFLLVFPVGELLAMGRWSGMEYTQRQLNYLYLSLWRCEFLQLGAVAAAVIAFLAALNSFWYLYSPRKVDFYHSLPVKRSGLFIQRVLLSVLYYIVPYVLMEFAAVCIGATRGYYSLEIMKKALQLLLIHLLIYLLVYFSTVLVIALTGTMLMGAIAWMGLFFYSIILVLMIQLSGHFFFMTWYDRDYGILAAIKKYGSPLTVVSSFVKAYMGGTYGKQLGILVLAVIIMAAASWMAFCRRRSENTGKALVYSWMEPVFSILITIPSGVGIGMIFYMIPEGSARIPWWIFGMALGTVLVHGILEVIFSMDFHRFFNRKLQLLCMGGAVAFCALVMQADLLGYDSYFPSYKNLQGISVYSANLNYSEDLTDVEKNDNGTYKIRYATSADTGTALMRQPLLKKSKALYNSLKDIKVQNEKDPKTGNMIYVRYVSRFGREICRTYIADFGQAQKLMEALYDEKTWREDKYSMLQIDDQYLREISGVFCDGYSHTLFEKDNEKQRALADALREDIQDADGAIVKDQPCALLMLDYQNIPSEGYMQNIPAAKQGESFTGSVLVYPGYKRTLAILKETGYPLSISELPVEKINVYYYSSDNIGEETDLTTDEDGGNISVQNGKFEATENGYKVSYDSPDQLKALEKCLRPGQLFNGWSVWRADATVEIRLKGQKDTEEGVCVSFVGEIPDFIRADAQTAHVTEWEGNN